MRKKQLKPILNTSSGSAKPPNLSGRLGAIRYLNEVRALPSARRNYETNIQHIADAVVAAGYTSLDKQAKALGIHRSTAWTIIKTKHKLDRLSTKTTNRMLANPELPPSVRAIIHRYLTERCASPKYLSPQKNRNGIVQN
jgi:hypothetical protein